MLIRKGLFAVADRKIKSLVKSPFRAEAFDVAWCDYFIYGIFTQYRANCSGTCHIGSPFVPRNRKFFICLISKGHLPINVYYADFPGLAVARIGLLIVVLAS